MQKILFKKVHVEKIDTDLEYYLICDGKRHGVEVSYAGRDKEICFIDDPKENVFEFLQVLADNDVMPEHLTDILEERKADRFSAELCRNFMKAYRQTTFNRS